MTLAGVLLVVLLGAAAVVAGGADDSPGLQGLGVLAVLGALGYGLTALRRRRAERAPGRTDGEPGRPA